MKLGDGTRKMSNEEKLTRICDRCGITLDKSNTGELGYFQPCCNECTIKNESECDHKWTSNARHENNICILCGYINDSFINFPSIDDDFPLSTGTWIINCSDDAKKKYVNILISILNTKSPRELEKTEHFQGLRIIAASRIR